MISQFFSRILVGIASLALIIAFATPSIAQQSEEPDKVSDTCDIEVAPIDSKQLAAYPERTKARIIAQMLQDMDRCIGSQQTRIASTQQTSTPGTQGGSLGSQNPLSSGTLSSDANASTQSNEQVGENSIENAISNSDPSDQSIDDDRSDTRQSSEVWRNDSNPPTSLQHNTNIFDFGSDDELVLDDYAKTLHEAYLAETDPVLKEALGKELTNYLNNKKK